MGKISNGKVKSRQWLNPMGDEDQDNRDYKCKSIDLKPLTHVVSYIALESSVLGISSI